MTTTPVAAADWLVVAPVALPILCGAVLLMVRHRIWLHAWIAMAGTSLMLASSLGLLLRSLSAGPRTMVMGGWLPPFGIAFTADVLGAAFSVAAGAVAVACCAFSLSDIGSTGRRYGFYAFFMLLMAGVNGSLLTGDLFNLYVWFEVFVISSFGLLVLGSEREQIDGAVKYAILNLTATTLFLAAAALLYGAVGTLNMADLTLALRAQTAAPIHALAGLFLFAFAMKAAAFPLNFWLPASYHTPRIVVAALFGALLTKIGIYALLRVLAMIMPGGLESFGGLVAWAAAATMILGGLGALAQSDLRRLCGFLVISGIGVMLAGLAVGGTDGLSGTILYAIQSMLAMAALYLACDAIRDRGGDISLNRLGGLYASAPLLAAVMLLLLLAIGGLPPGSGLWAKVVVVKAALDHGFGWLAFCVLASGALSMIALARVFLLAFWRPAQAPAASVTPPSPTMLLPLLGLSAAILWIGLLPETVLSISRLAAGGLVDPAAYVGSVFPGGLR
ncbi:MAG: Na+/H+ antiporter subunit D [Rhizobiaceae bacterium]|nr:Na+/H+ antiporter subunit D [Rhizobiaceae bacterium]